MKSYSFQAQIQKHDGMDAAYITFPYDVEREFGTKGQLKVQALIEDAPYRGSLAKMGLDCHCLGITKQIRTMIGKVPGDWVQVTLLQDLEPRVVELPEDFKALLEANGQANLVYNKLSYSHKKEYMTWILSAKKTETRTKRMEQAIIRLTEASE